jgi:hypothetical protein
MGQMNADTLGSGVQVVHRMGLYEKRLQVKPLQKLLDLDRTEPDPEE